MNRKFAAALMTACLLTACTRNVEPPSRKPQQAGQPMDPASVAQVSEAHLGCSTRKLYVPRVRPLALPELLRGSSGKVLKINESFTDSGVSHYFALRHSGVRGLVLASRDAITMSLP